MQKLQFEASWNKALSIKDRDLITTIFNETKDSGSSAIVFSPIREAINYKKDLLITVLVHNFSHAPFTFENARLVYLNGQEVLAESTFTLPALTIPPYVSMPWTLIFPKGSYTSSSSLLNGRLEIRK
jgi:SLAP domain-containing protein